MLTQRCAWVPTGDPLYVAYHDLEWGVPIHDDQKLFEFLILEGFQAGLSWRTILYKRDNFRQAFDDFDPSKIAAYGDEKIAELLSNPGIVRNKAKVQASITNARAFLSVKEEFGNFDAYIWQFTGGNTLKNAWTNMGELPAHTPESNAMSKDLLKRGFRFVGSTICYAHMQATGTVNDHTIDCFRYDQV